MGHHMALLTAFESGLVHIAECPQNLRYFLGKDIMKRLPTAWDESRLLEGAVQKYATIARRSGEDWWVAGVTTSQRNCRLTFDFLDEGKTYTAYIYRDGSCRSDLKFTKMQVTKGQTVNVTELSEGGFLMQVSTRDDLDVPAERMTYEAEATGNTLTGNGRRNTYDALHASGGGYVGYLGLGNKLQFNSVKVSQEGDYLLTLYYMTQDTRYSKLLVNGEQVGDTIVFHGNSDVTSTYNPEGMGWKMIPVRLKAGTNTITIQTLQDKWAPNFDRITIHPLSTGTGVTAASAGTDTLLGDASIYDLTGHRLSSVPDSGIYICGGRKFAFSAR